MLPRSRRRPVRVIYAGVHPPFMLTCTPHYGVAVAVAVSVAVVVRYIDGTLQVTDQEAIDMGYHVLQNDGVFIGPVTTLPPTL